MFLCVENSSAFVWQPLPTLAGEQSRVCDRRNSVLFLILSIIPVNKAGANKSREVREALLAWAMAARRRDNNKLPAYNIPNRAYQFPPSFKFTFVRLVANIGGYYCGWFACLNERMLERWISTL